MSYFILSHSDLVNKIITKNITGIKKKANNFYAVHIVNKVVKYKLFNLYYIVFITV